MKKIISGLLTAAMLMSGVISASALTDSTADPDLRIADDFTVGDVNGDGAVDMKDSLALRKYCAGIGGADENAADINADGTVNAKDLLIIKKCNAQVDDIANYADDAAVDSFTIAGNDISTYSIVYDEGAKYVENMYYAADTLRKFIASATGDELTVSTEPAGENVIRFVDVTTVDGMEEKLEIENYSYEVKDGDLLIYGTRRGSLYAVYEILEDHLGYRFYSDQFTYQYAARTVDIEEGTEVFRRPYLKFRICKQGFWENDYVHYFPRRLNGSQHGDHSEALGTLTGPHFINAHSFGYYWKMATGEVDVVFNGTNHNDYGAKYEAGVQNDESSWNPCFTSDLHYATLFRGLLETMRYMQNWDYWYKHTFREETSCISFSICDNRTVCPCIDCRYIMSSQQLDKEGTMGLGCGEAGLNLYIANRACRDIKAYYESYDEDGYWTGRAAGIEETDIVSDEDWYSYGYGEAIKDAYPTMDIYTILYDHTMPHELLMTDDRYEKIRPEENLIIMFCGNPCNNHYMGANECNGNLNILTNSGEEDAAAFAAWGDITKQTGTQMWFWYYPVNYNNYVSDSPNIFNIWYDFKYVIEECNVTGIYYEGAGRGYLFENLKSHLASVFMWSMVENEDGSVSYMSYDEFIEAMKEYLRFYYGAGWEYIYEYICMQDEAGDLSGICYVNNCDYPGDMFDYEYIRDNYEYMRELALKALALAEGEEIQRCEFVLMNCEVMGLSAVHRSWYLDENATAEHKAAFEERYTWLYEFLRYEVVDNAEDFTEDKETRVLIGSAYGADYMDSVELDFSKSPLVLLYGGGTWRPALDEEWGWTGSTPVWGYYG